MRILVLHSVAYGRFVPDLHAVRAMIASSAPDMVVNLVESVWGRGLYAPLGTQMLEDIGVKFTGASSGSIAMTSNKLQAKRMLLAAGLPTAPWAEGPDWEGLVEGQRWIVKSLTEDASLGLDDGAVVTTRAAAQERSSACISRFGGRWFAETYIDGREFNVAVIERAGRPIVLPIGEMVFTDWDAARPRIVGYSAKWLGETSEYNSTPRVFDWASKEPALYADLEDLAKKCWSLFGCRGYGRVDYRVDGKGRPFILEVNANPCLEPDAGFAAAASQAGISYAELVNIVVAAAH